MPDFTKGKWVDCGDCTVGVENEDGTIKCWICECEPDYVHIEEENARANARLIAAAPDLYNLLFSALGHMYEAYNTSTNNVFKHMVMKDMVMKDIERIEALFARIDGSDTDKEEN